MNLFRLLGDFAHLYSIVILIYKIHTRRTTAGISLRTRVLYLLVFIARYGDLFLYFISLYNTLMKIGYLAMSGYIVWLMLFSEGYKHTWYSDLDDFPTIPILIGSAVLGVITTNQFTILEILWTFSIVLESVAILPQISHLTKVPTLPALPLSHLVALGLYRFFYVLNWIYHIGTDGAWMMNAFFFGVVQTIIWADFLWVWYNRKQIRLSDQAITPNAGGGVSIGTAGDAAQVDSGDLAQSFLLSHIFSVSKAIEVKFLNAVGGGLRSTGPSLSVSAYPEQDLRSAEEGRSAGFSDAVEVPAEPVQPAEPVTESPQVVGTTKDDFDDDELTAKK